jgi:DNA polymerase type B, organellar and viral
VDSAYGAIGRLKGPKVRVRASRAHKGPKVIIGVDGEGQGRAPHLYTFLAACDESGRTWSTENVNGLGTAQCLRFLLGFPPHTLVMGFSFQYDLTKILKDLPDVKLYDLFHEARRAYFATINGFRRVLYRPIEWQGFSINLLNRQLTVKRGKTRVKVWDIFRFFQGKFTQALTDWRICASDVIDEMVVMKDKRSEFDKLEWQSVKTYCLGECLQLAKLGRALITAHDEACLTLTDYYGAGSTAKTFLKRIGIADKRGVHPTKMLYPIACAFFGGRFENSVIGKVQGPVYNADISSAYPYQCYHLPCLEHGKWSHALQPKIREIYDARLALVHWTSILDGTRKGAAWGALPVRNEKGSILFPLYGFGGWTWKEEFLESKRLADTEPIEAWLYHTDCECRPFAEIADIYRERLRIGKEGKGIVLKLASNSVYGKMAQSLGNAPPFQSWIWAGNVTSGTRAQLLQSLDGSERDWDVLMFATDGVFSTRKIKFPKPRDTGTFDLEKPLGGWEHKTIPSGVFCARPGIYFPLDMAENPSDTEVKAIRARGLGKKILYEKWREIIRAYEGGETSVTFGNVTRFIGAKTGLSRGEKSGVKRSAGYGEWVSYPITMSFDPSPKREKILSNGRLSVEEFVGTESEPYERAYKRVATPEFDADLMTGSIETPLFDSEQPDSVYGEEG